MCALTIGGAEQSLLRSIRGGRNAHAYLIACPNAAQAEELVLRASALLCFGDEHGNLAEYPDFLRYDGESMVVDDVRGLLGELKLLPYSNATRVIYIAKMHTLDEYKQNMLLKTFEEPPASTVIFITGSEAGILPTIRSRCAAIRIPPQDERTIAQALERIGTPPGRAKYIAAMCGGRQDIATRLAEDESFFELMGQAIKLLTHALDGMPDFETPRGWTGSAGRENARHAATFMLMFMDNILNCQLGAKQATDDEIKKYAAKISIKQTGNVIGLITDLMRKLSTTASVGNAFDFLWAEMVEGDR